jgi:hypothetical protein
MQFSLFKKLLFYLSITVAAVVIVLYWVRMYAQHNEIDELQDVLMPIKNSLPENAQIAFASNLDSAENLELYLKAQYVMVPRILLLKDTSKKEETVLLVERKAAVVKKPVNLTDTLVFAQSVHFSAGLYKRK